MLLKSRLGRHLVTRVARAYGFLDPVALLARLRGFAQTSEVGEPIELLRAGVLFHARGLVNTKAIQHNLDWVWPYWVEKQFNPHDPSFIPRAFSFSHINLTHRNWTAVGLPDVPYYPIVDPRGLVTPLYDGWSLDFWVLPEKGPALAPSKLADFDQQLHVNASVSVRSVARWPGQQIASTVQLVLERDEPVCRILIRAAGAGEIVVALRPYNPEGVSAVQSVELHDDAWLVNGRHPVFFSRTPLAHRLSNYAEGDVAVRLHEPMTAPRIDCAAAMATAAAIFPIAPDTLPPLEIRVPIFDEFEPGRRPRIKHTPPWPEALAPFARLAIADAPLQRLYDLALANVVLHTPEDPYPGPYTYKRFWFRDAVFMLNALLTLGGVERTRRALHRFLPRQRRDGYFLSQEGEWDSNGEVLWFFGRFAALTGETLPGRWLESMARGARWIQRKRLPRDSGRSEAGLLPAGFSAEHLGPNDFYYWDDFWAVAGLRAAARWLGGIEPALAQACAAEADEFLATIVRSFPRGPHRRYPGAIPASPHRRMDSGAIGSIVADYPLQLFPPGDEAMRRTADFLWEHCRFGGGFLQDMIHSGINVYLTLHLAQVRLRAGQVAHAWEMIDTVARLASPTGQWPEAIHPRTGGGCMGDGQHLWAAAEWLLMLRNLFVREEGDALVVGAGLHPRWLAAGEARFGPTLTPHGAVTLRAARTSGGVRVTIDAHWTATPPVRELRVPGCAPLTVAAGDPPDDFLLPFAP
ncbi:MAG: hypothetical protein HYV96_01700 [Opitutae bacterium]|nr:hypothetical protein [Opitutae bacterium]